MSSVFVFIFLLFFYQKRQIPPGNTEDYALYTVGQQFGLKPSEKQPFNPILSHNFLQRLIVSDLRFAGLLDGLDDSD
jgi:hypothetical protein